MARNLAGHVLLAALLLFYAFTLALSILHG
jgi:hypothetical protein